MNDITVCGGDDDVLDYGEVAQIYSTFENVGSDPSAELTSYSNESPVVNIITQEIIIESVPAGEEVTIGPFDIEGVGTW